MKARSATHRIAGARLLGLGLACLFACTDIPKTFVTLHDPQGLADRAAIFVVRGRDGQSLGEIEREGRSFPFTFFLESEFEATRTYWIEASLTRTSSAVARSLATVTFARSDPPTLLVTFGRPCESTPDCDDGIFCNGLELCEDRICGAQQDACPISPVDCVEVTCLETLDRCEVQAKHATCSEGQYCDITLGCSLGQACTNNQNCDDGATCNGTETCVGGRCVRGEPVVMDDGNPCTIDACIEPDGPRTFPALDGSTCRLPGSDAPNGECLDQKCVPIVPPDVHFLLVDANTGLYVSTTRSPTVAVEFGEVEANITAWHLSETAASAPDSSDPGWALARPTHHVLSPEPGLKTVYLWVRTASGAINPGQPPSRADVYLTPSAITVGPVADGCPRATGGLCLYHGADALQAAVDDAVSGDVIWLYEGRFSGSLTISKPLVIEGAPGEDLLNIEVGPSEGSVIQLNADRVTLRGFHLLGNQDSTAGIEAGPGGGPHTRGHLVERVIMEAVWNRPDLNDSKMPVAFRFGSETIFRNSWILGWWSGASFRGNSSTPVRNAYFVHNTVVTPEPQFVNLGATEHLVVANNIFLNFNNPALGLFYGDEDTVDVQIENNLVFGSRGFVGSALPLGINNRVVDPRLVNMNDPRPGVGSPAIDGGRILAEAGSVDLWGQSRRVGLPDVGAIELQGASPPEVLGQKVRIGTVELGCPAAQGTRCDFFHRSGDAPVLRRALKAAHPGSTLMLFSDDGGVARYRVGSGSSIPDERDYTIDRTLTLRRAETEPPQTVVLDEEGVQVVGADDVAFVGLHFDLTSITRNAVWFHGGDGGDADHPFAALRGRVERCMAENTWVGGANAAFHMGPEGQVLSSAVFGLFRAFASTSARDVRVIGNSFRPKWRSFQGNTQAFTLRGAQNFIAANNVIDLRFAENAGGRLPAATDQNTIGSVFVSNQFYGLDEVRVGSVIIRTGASTPPGSNCVIAADGSPLSGSLPSAARCSGVDPLLDGDFRPQVSPVISPVVGAADMVYEGGDLDLFDQPRVSGGRLDVGAVQAEP